MDKTPKAVGPLRAAFSRVLASREWAGAGSAADRVELLVEATCDTVGGRAFTYLPTYETISSREGDARRRARIRAEFDGGNHHDIAERHGLSLRQVRRIVEPRHRRRK